MKNKGRYLKNKTWINADIKNMEEKNRYFLQSFTLETPPQNIIFYKLNKDGTWEDGTTLEEMLRICIERLIDLDRKISCEENFLAIIKMREALMWLKVRTEDRIKRGVEGKHLA